jgi:hypothetical protein
MATGDIHIQAKFVANAVTAYLASANLKIAFISSSTTPAVADSDPRWGTGGAQNYSTNEVSGGNFAAGGTALTSFAISLSGAVTSLKATSPLQVVANPANPTTARWGVIYDTVSAIIIGYLDLGGVTDLTLGLNWNINAQISGSQPIFTFTAN